MTTLPVFSKDGSFGTIEARQRADLILLQENPLENGGLTRNRTGMMGLGQWLTQAELDGMVAEYVASYQTSDTARAPSK